MLIVLILIYKELLNLKGKQPPKSSASTRRLNTLNSHPPAEVSLYDSFYLTPANAFSCMVASRYFVKNGWVRLVLQFLAFPLRLTCWKFL